LKEADVIILRLLHFIFATIWVGGGFYYNFILLPNLRQMDGRTQRSVITVVTQTMAPLLGISALITIVSGGVMLALLRTEHGTNFLTTGWGISMMVGLITSILAMVLVFAVEVPTGKRLVHKLPVFLMYFALIKVKMNIPLQRVYVLRPCAQSMSCPEVGIAL
jgi:uncharacterized membrane protein